MNRTASIATAGALFCAGLFLGLALRRNPSLPPGAMPTKAGSENTLRPEPQASSPDLVKLEGRVRELEAELAKVRGTPATSDAGLTPGALEELVKAYVAMNRDKNADPDKARLLFARLSQLDQKSGGFFIDHYRKANGEDAEDEREVALELALASAGPAAAEFIQTLLNDPSLDPIVRANLLMELSGLNGGFFSIKRLPVNESLAATAMTLARSTKSEEREAAAGLLGGVSTEASRVELTRLIEQDPQTRVKTAAVLSLSHVGTVSTRTFLEAYWVSQQQTFKGQEGARLRSALESTMKRLAEEPR